MPADSALPPRLRGLKLDRILDAASGSACSPMLATPWTPPEPGELAALFPGFEIARLIGRGGMGAVYEARQLALERRVAIKLLPVEAGRDTAFAERFRREARTLAKLQHPNIVAVFESGETTAGHLYFVMEYVEGGDLAERARRGAFEPGEALRLVDEISAALACAHALGVVHRDIKPSNILLTADGHAKVADFGLAVLEDREPDSKLTLTGIALGTFDYAAPEQLAGRGGEDARSDLYSLGVLAYELLAGKPPRGVFDPPSLANPAVDPAVDAVVLTALQSEPERRFQSAGDFSVALNRARDFRANQLAHERELRRKARRRTRLALAAMLAAAAAIGVAGFAFVQRRAAQAQRTAAEQSRAEVESLVDFMLTDLRQKLERSGGLDALDDVLARAAAYFESVPAGSRGQAFEHRRFEFLRTKTLVLRARKLPGAVDAGKAALALAQSIAETEPDSPLSLRMLARAHYELGFVQFWLGDNDEAMRCFREYQAAAARWLERERSFDARSAAATASLEIARVLMSKKRLAEAQAQYAEAQKLFTALAEEKPDDGGIRHERDWMEAELGSLCEEEGRLEDALAHFQKLKQLMAAQAEREKWGAGAKQNYLHALLRVGTALQKLGRNDEALREMDEAIPLAIEHAARRPGNREHLALLEWAYRIARKALEGAGRTADAAEMRLKHKAVQEQMDGE